MWGHQCTGFPSCSAGTADIFFKSVLLCPNMLNLRVIQNNVHTGCLLRKKTELSFHSCKGINALVVPSVALRVSQNAAAC